MEIAALFLSQNLWMTKDNRNLHLWLALTVAYGMPCLAIQGIAPPVYLGTGMSQIQYGCRTLGPLSSWIQARQLMRGFFCIRLAWCRFSTDQVGTACAGILASPT